MVLAYTLNGLFEADTACTCALTASHCPMQLKISKLTSHICPSLCKLENNPQRLNSFSLLYSSYSGRTLPSLSEKISNSSCYLTWSSRMGTRGFLDICAPEGPVARTGISLTRIWSSVYRLFGNWRQKKYVWKRHLLCVAADLRISKWTIRCSVKGRTRSWYVVSASKETSSSRGLAICVSGRMLKQRLLLCQ